MNHLKVLSDSLMLQSQAMLFRSALSKGAEVDALKAELDQIPSRIAEARDTAAAEVLESIPGVVQQALVAERMARREAVMRTARRVGCAVLWGLITAGTVWLFRQSSAAQTPLGAFLLAASYVVLTHGLWRLARDGRVEGGLGRVADVLGIIAYIVLLQQTFTGGRAGGQAASAPTDRPGGAEGEPAGAFGAGAARSLPVAPALPPTDAAANSKGKPAGRSGR